MLSRRAKGGPGDPEGFDRLDELERAELDEDDDTPRPDDWADESRVRTRSTAPPPREAQSA